MARNITHTVIRAELAFVGVGEDGRTAIRFVMPYESVKTTEHILYADEPEYPEILSIVHRWNKVGWNAEYGDKYQQPAISLEELETQAHDLGDTIRDLEPAELAYKEAQQKWEEEYADVIAARNSLRAQRDEIELTVRCNAVRIHQADPAKANKAEKIMAGVGIEYYTAAVYDPVALRAAAFTLFPGLLVLDERRVKALALSLENQKPLTEALSDLPLKPERRPRTELSESSLKAESEVRQRLGE